MALDESNDEMSPVESNGITAYMTPDLAQLVTTLGPVQVDFVNPGFGRAGFSVKIGPNNCSDCSC